MSSISEMRAAHCFISVRAVCDSWRMFVAMALTSACLRLACASASSMAPWLSFQKGRGMLSLIPMIPSFSRPSGASSLRSPAAKTEASMSSLRRACSRAMAVPAAFALMRAALRSGRFTEDAPGMETVGMFPERLTGVAGGMPMRGRSFPRAAVSSASRRRSSVVILRAESRALAASRDDISPRLEASEMNEASSSA